MDHQAGYYRPNGPSSRWKPPRRTAASQSTSPLQVRYVQIRELNALSPQVLTTRLSGPGGMMPAWLHRESIETLSAACWNGSSM
jgi:hypothetical protein